MVPGCETLTLPEFPEDVEPTPITPNDDFYAQSCCGVPLLDVELWQLTIKVGGVEVAVIDKAYLDSLELRYKEHTLQCIGGGPSMQQISNAIWGGLPLRELLDDLGVEIPESAVSQKWVCADGYHTGLPIGDTDTMWAVWVMNDRELPPKHGAPLRLLTPGRYGTKNPKWPVELDFVDEPYLGYWEQRNWSDEAPYLPNGLIGSPRDFTVVNVGEVLVRGTAFAGDDPIAKVELTTDGGETWTEVERYYAGEADIWTLWRHTWRPDAPGIYTVQVRVTTASGATSSPSPDATNVLDGYDGSMAIEVEVV